MDEFYLREEDEYIKLGQLLKACGFADSGSAAKEEILYGNVLVNGKKEYQRGKKIRPGDIVEFNGEKVVICR